MRSLLRCDWPSSNCLSSAKGKGNSFFNTIEIVIFRLTHFLFSRYKLCSVTSSLQLISQHSVASSNGIISSNLCCCGVSPLHCFHHPSETCCNKRFTVKQVSSLRSCNVHCIRTKLQDRLQEKLPNVTEVLISGKDHSILGYSYKLNNYAMYK